MKFPEATKADREAGWSLDYKFLHKISEFIDKKRRFVYTEAEIEDVLIVAQQIMEEQKQKENRCTCERCTGIPCESLYAEDDGNPFGLGK